MIFTFLKNVLNWLVDAREQSVRRDIERLEKMGTFSHYGHSAIQPAYIKNKKNK